MVASSSKLEYCSFGNLWDSNCKRISEGSFSFLNALQILFFMVSILSVTYASIKIIVFWRLTLMQQVSDLIYYLSIKKNFWY